MAREHGICRQRALNGLILICLGLLAAGLLVPAAAGAGSADVTQSANTSAETDHETTEVVIDLSSWTGDHSASISIDLPSAVASWLEVVFTELVELPEPDDSDEPADLPEESEDADDESDDRAGDDGSDDADEPDDGADDETPDDHADDEDGSESDDDGAGDTDDGADDGSDDQTDADDGTDDGDSDGTDDADDGDDGTDDQLTHEDRVESAIHDEINQVRAEHGLEALAFDDDLADIAREHSEDMAERDYFSHTTPEGETVGDRYANAGISCQAWGENILYNYHGEESPQVIAERSVQQWMDSDDHRENILSEQWDSEGIGVSIDGSEVYATQKFGTNCS